MDFLLLAPFIADKAGKTGISVTCTVINVDTLATVVSSQTATEVGLGVYKYNWQNATPINALAVFQTTDTTVDQKSVFSFISKEQMMIQSGAFLDEVIVGTYTLKQILNVIVSTLAGKASGGGTSTIKFRNLTDTADAITASVDSDGNRTALTINV